MPEDVGLKDFSKVEGKVKQCKTCRLANLKALYFGEEGYCLANAEVKDGKCDSCEPIEG